MLPENVLKRVHAHTFLVETQQVYIIGSSAVGPIAGKTGDQYIEAMSSSL